MSTTINNTMSGYSVKNPWNGQLVSFNSILQAVSYCRNHGLIYRLAF